jgi:hypothetical protein
MALRFVESDEVIGISIDPEDTLSVNPFAQE